MTAEGRAASFPSAAPLAVGLIHAVLFVFAGWTAVATAGGFLIGPFEAAPFFPVLAVILVGGIRVAAGAAGGRALLLAGDLGLAGLLAAKPLLHDPEFLELPSAWYLALAALALVAALIAAILVPRPVRGSIVRRPRDRALLLALIVADVVTTLWSAAANADAARMDVGAYAVELAAETAPFDIALFGAWWSASRWPLGLTGAAGLLVGLSSTAFAAADPLRWAVFLVPYLLSVVAGLVGPAPAGVAIPTTAPGPSRSRPATVWIAVGAIGWPLLVFAGSFPIVLDACLECGPRFPGDSLVWLLGVLTVVAVPICALLAITTGGSRPEAADPFRWILLAGSGVVLLEILAGAAGVLRFGFLGYAAPPVLLVGLGAIVSLRRPPWLAHAGTIAALGAAGLVWVWAWGVRIRFGGATLGDFTFAAASLAQAAIAAVLIARESSRVRWRAATEADRKPAAVTSREPSAEPA